MRVFCASPSQSWFHQRPVRLHALRKIEGVDDHAVKVKVNGEGRSGIYDARVVDHHVYEGVFLYAQRAVQECPRLVRGHYGPVPAQPPSGGQVWQGQRRRRGGRRRQGDGGLGRDAPRAPGELLLDNVIPLVRFIYQVRSIHLQAQRMNARSNVDRIRQLGPLGAPDRLFRQQATTRLCGYQDAVQVDVGPYRALKAGKANHSVIRI